jgi:hypothetical protein
MKGTLSTVPYKLISSARPKYEYEILQCEPTDPGVLIKNWYKSRTKMLIINRKQVYIDSVGKPRFNRPAIVMQSQQQGSPNQ